jgi:hypothetical protein
MSTGSRMDITCGCGHGFRAWLWQSANVTASPDLRKKILGGQMNVVRCPECGSTFHVEIPFLYHDLEAREWIWVYPASHEQQGGTIHARVQEMWEELKSTLPPDVREVMDREYRVLVLFGMDALVYYLQAKQVYDAERPSS